VGMWELVMVIIGALIATLALAAVWFGLSARIIMQYERRLVFRFGRVLETIRGPGLNLIVPAVDRLRTVNMQIVTMPVPAQVGITRDNVTVRVDAVVYFNVVDPVRAIVSVQDYMFAVSQVAQTSLRSMIGKSELDDLLINRERLNQGLEIMIDSPALDWGVHIDRVEIKDVALPESMKRSMSRQAEAERERRARVITAEGELQASQKLAQAAAIMADTPAALQLRLLQTVVVMFGVSLFAFFVIFVIFVIFVVLAQDMLALAGMPDDDRQILGKMGEDLACAELCRRGYAILARRYRTRHGEIDIIARDGEMVVFVEVKARRDEAFGEASEAITAWKQQRIVRMATDYLARHSLLETPCRFDVVAIDFEGDCPRIEVYTHAFTA